MSSLVRTIQRTRKRDPQVHYLGRGAQLGVKNPKATKKSTTPKALRRSKKALRWFASRHQEA